MARVYKREAAKRDLIEYFVYLAENASLLIAERFMLAADNTLEQLAKMPNSGTPVHFKDPQLFGMRRWRVTGFEKCLLFYFPLPNGIDLVRVVHASRDLERLFGAP